MKSLFADTFYFQARLNPRDQYHERVLAWSRESAAPLVTTELVLVELANSLARSRSRRLLRDFYALLRRTADVVPAHPVRLAAAWSLYHQHADKFWSLTDCFSFIVMRERNLPAALTNDHHFAQAGFTAVFE
jgi:predicted nucleic acid-binding protein